MPISANELKQEAMKSTEKKDHAVAYLTSKGKKLMTELSDAEIDELFRQLVAIN